MADTTATVSATHRVLNTTELLENILLYVDMRTLLLSQRTSTSFHDTIGSSPVLQQKLFFRPLPPPGTKTRYLCSEPLCKLPVCSHIPPTDARYSHPNPLLANARLRFIVELQYPTDHPTKLFERHDFTLEQVRDGKCFYLTQARGDNLIAAGPPIQRVVTPGSWQKMLPLHRQTGPTGAGVLYHCFLTHRFKPWEVAVLEQDQGRTWTMEEILLRGLVEHEALERERRAGAAADVAHSVSKYWRIFMAVALLAAWGWLTSGPGV